MLKQISDDQQPTAGLDSALLPRRRWLGLFAGTLLALSVYYLDYTGNFDEGSAEGSNKLVFLMRLISAFLVTVSLRPFKVKHRAPWMLLAFYGICAFSYALSIGLTGQLNDVLFLNTVLQLPVLWAICQTRWYIDFARWFRFIGVVLVIESIVDVGVLLNGKSLWGSDAFVGGLGNPSSFGVSCVILSAFFLFHPEAGRARTPMAAALSIAAVMTKSLFAALGVGVIFSIWVLRDMRRVFVTLIGLIGVGIWLNSWLTDHGQEIFLMHKLLAAGALIGLVNYDVDSSRTVSLRSEMHEHTFTAMTNQPLSLIFGHVEGKAYWPNDSQILTYLGSFGAVMLVVFLLLHLLWFRRALRNGHLDGKFSAIALMIFGLIFLTNRILDYFPLAILYFLCIAAATTNYIAPADLQSGRLRSAHIVKKHGG